MPLVDIVAGARPNFMKIAPIIRALEAHKRAGGALDYRLVHTGQHYDARMSGEFFTQLGIPAPDVNLEVGSGSHAEQTAGIMVAYERLLREAKSDACLVVGDVTSTMSCAITAQKLHIPVAHVEAGIRSGDWTMPEEINRLVTDSITNWFFTTSEFANASLRRSGVEEERIHFVGNTMIDTLIANLDRLLPPAFWPELGLAAGEYFLVTLHRPANVDAVESCGAMIDAISRGAGDRTVVFPVHPRTRKTLDRLDAIPGNVFLTDPQPYLEFIYLVRNAAGVVTDSGGITEEATYLGIPCLTLRDSTERPETIEIGTNELIGTDPAALPPAMERVRRGAWKTGGIPEKWDGRAGERIVSILAELLGGPACP
jgi:UDP-N-acetylglucosamine 2-epimerase (non-hydrolysing)